MGIFTKDLGIDLGTLNLRVTSGGQVVMDEPVIAAIVTAEQKMVEWGKAAREMLGRVPESIEVTRPMVNGVIADYEVVEYILTDVLRKVGGAVKLFRPNIMMTVPIGVTSVERRAVHEAALQAGGREVYLIQQPLAAAIGVDLPIGTPRGNMVLCLGGGTTQCAVIAMYGIVASESIRLGGLQLDEAIIAYVRKKYKLILGQTVAEQVKIEIGAALPMEEKALEIQGQDQVTGLPRPVTLTTGEIVEALEEPLHEMVEVARRTLEKTPPDLVSDIIDLGVAVCGGSSLLRGFERLLTRELGVPAYLVDNPTTCISEGAARGLAMYPLIRRHLPAV